MDMRNVAHLVGILSFSSGSSEGFSYVKEAALFVFGDNETIEKYMQKVTAITNNMSEEDFADMMKQSAIGCFALLKADLEADAMKEKENAS